MCQECSNLIFLPEEDVFRADSVEIGSFYHTDHDGTLDDRLKKLRQAMKAENTCLFCDKKKTMYGKKYARSRSDRAGDKHLAT